MSRVPLVVERFFTHPVRIPYARPIQWGGLSEESADYLLLEIVTKDGLSGIAEGTVKTAWTGATLRSLTVIVEEVFAPRFAGVDVAEPEVVAEILDRIPENRLVKAMTDVACWDLRAQVARKPLWQLWGGNPLVYVSWTVTRQQPLDMAQEAGEKIAEHGFRILKVKTGQGFETDFAALDAIRRAVGDSVRIYADSNGAYRASEVPTFTAGLQDCGVFLAEDPCHVLPSADFEWLRRTCALPLLIDHRCRSLSDARLFLERGAEAISVKIGKSGMSESMEIIHAAHQRGAKAHIGFLGESSLGSLAALQLAAAIPGRENWLPAETSFFLSLPQEFVHAPLKIKDGVVVLPEEPSFGKMIDWNRVRALQP